VEFVLRGPVFEEQNSEGAEEMAGREWAEEMAGREWGEREGSPMGSSAFWPS